MAKYGLMAKYFFHGTGGQFMAKFRNLAMNMANLATLDVNLSVAVETMA